MPDEVVTAKGSARGEPLSTNGEPVGFVAGPRKSPVFLSLVYPTGEKGHYWRWNHLA